MLPIVTRILGAGAAAGQAIDLVGVLSLYANGLGRALVEVVAIELFAELPRLSPVGSPARGDKHPGKYRASHTPSLGAPKPVQLPDQPSYGVPGVAEILGVLDSWRAPESIFISNAVRSDGAAGGYAPRLERGWSKQAPRGIYGPAIDAVRSRVGSLQPLVAQRMAQRIGHLLR